MAKCNDYNYSKDNNDELLSVVEETQWNRNINMQLRTAENVFYQRRIGTFSYEGFIGYLNFDKRSQCWHKVKLINFLTSLR